MRLAGTEYLTMYWGKADDGLVLFYYSKLNTNTPSASVFSLCGDALQGWQARFFHAHFYEEVGMP